MTDNEMIDKIHQGIGCFEEVVEQLQFQPQRRVMEFNLNDIIKDAYKIMRNFNKVPDSELEPRGQGYGDFKQVFGNQFSGH